MKAEIPQDEAARLEWLRTSEILDSAPEQEYDEIVRLASDICGVPISAISLIDQDRQWFKAIRGLDASETPRELAFCAHTILHTDVFVVEDATADPRFSENPLVTDDPGIRFYAGAPLITSDGIALGALCVVDRSPRRMSDQQRSMLKLLASQIAGRLELQRRIVQHEQLAAEAERVQKALRQREEQLNAIVEQAIDGICIVEPSTRRVLMANAAFREMLGYTEDEAKELTLYDFVGHTRSNIDKKVKEALEHGAMTIGERQYVRKDGKILIVEVRARIINYDGQAVICSMATDLTPRRAEENARRQAEASLANLFHHAAEGIFQTTRSGQYLQVNPALAKIYGYESPDQMMRELVDISGQLYLEKDRRKEFVRIMSAHGSVVGFESQVRRRDGRVIWISETARQVYDSYGTLSYYEGFVQDITDRKQLEAQREHDLSEAERRADCDSLTDLWNHRAFHNLVEVQLGGARASSGRQAIVLLDVDNFKFFNDLYGYLTGDDVLRLVAERLRTICEPGDVLGRFGGDEFAIFFHDVGLRSRSDIEQDLHARLADLTFHPAEHVSDIPITLSIGAAVSCTGVRATRTELVQDADSRLRWAKTGGDTDGSADRIRSMLSHTIEGFSMLDALVTAVDNKDRYTRRHSEDVMRHCLAIAEEMGLSHDIQQNLAAAALLHDVGKIGVPDAILRKPGNLTDAEYEAIKLHPQMGAAIVSAVPGLEQTLDAVRHHHESYSGTGYPSALAGDAIPLAARIMAVADAFSAMTMDRPYRKGMDRSRAISILTKGSGKEWDPNCVDAFLRTQHTFDVERHPTSRAA